MTRFYTVALGLFIGCVNVPEEPERNAYARDLAWRYLELEVDSEGAHAINEEVRNLTAQEMRTFNEELKLLGNADELTSVIMDQITESAIAQGVATFDLDEKTILEAVEYVGDENPNFRSCPVGKTSCTVWNPSSTTNLYGASCGWGCTLGTSHDRLSTEACESGWPDFCDHRFFFPAANKSSIDGLTTAYDNWVLHYPSILGQHISSTTYALMGHTRMLQVGIVSADPSKLQVF